MASTAEDHARLLVSIEATQAKFSKQLARIAGDAGATATKIERDFARANDNSARSFQRGGVAAARGMGQARAAGQQLSFQLNDIATQLASGTSPFTIMAQQGGQVAQIINSSGGLRGSLGALSGAITGLLNPAGLLSVALIGITGYAVQYFAKIVSGGETSEKELKKQAQMIDAVASKWGAALPALKAYSDELKALADHADRLEASQLVQERILSPVRETFRKVTIPDAASVVSDAQTLGVDPSVINKFQDAIDNLRQKMEDGKVEAEDFQRVLDALDAAELKNVQSVNLFSKALRDQIPVATAATEKAKALQTEQAVLESKTIGLLSAYDGLTNGITEFTAKGQTGISQLIDTLEKMGTVSASVIAKMRADLKAAADAVSTINAGIGNIGQLAPLTSNNGMFMNPAQQQEWNANNTPSQFQQDLTKAGDAIDGFVNRVIKAESGGNPNAKNPSSSATGTGQFIESTWLSLFRKHYPQQAASMGRDAILDLRKNADVSAALIRKYAEENARILQMAGVHVDEAALQLSHFLGAGDAAKVLRAAPGTPLAGLISQASINENPTILGGGRTVDDARAYAQRRASASVSTAAPKKPPSDLFAGDMAQIQQRIDLLNQEAEAAGYAAAGWNDYGFSVEQARIKQQLINDAKQRGLEITPQLAAKIDQLATNYAKAATQGDRMAASQKSAEEAAKNAAEAQKEWADLATTAINGIANALQDGKITAQEWLQIGLQIIQQLLQMKSLGGGGAGGGGLLSGLFGGAGRGGGLLGGAIIPGILHKGGVAGVDGYGHSRAVSPSVFAGARRYHRGGVAGLQAGEVPAILQRGEIVLPKGGRGGGSRDRVDIMINDPSGMMAEVADRVIQSRAGTIVRVAVQQSSKTVRKQMPGMMAEAQTRAG